MKYSIVNILIIISFFSVTMANTAEGIEQHFSEQEQEMVIDIDQKELQPTTQDQRELRCQQKQEIKNQILLLYKEMKDEKEREIKKEVKNQIAELKKQLRTLNTKIAYSYKQQLKKFFGFK